MNISFVSLRFAQRAEDAVNLPRRGAIGRIDNERPIIRLTASPMAALRLQAGALGVAGIAGRTARGSAVPPVAVGADTGDDRRVAGGRQHLHRRHHRLLLPVVDDPSITAVRRNQRHLRHLCHGREAILALAILGMPLDKMPVETVREILRGGASVCAEAGFPIGGGHSIDAPEPIYGLAVIGICRPEQVRRNSDAKPGDALILTKGLGVGIYSAALKKGQLTATVMPKWWPRRRSSTVSVGELSTDAAVLPSPDVTGFGLLATL